MGTSKRAASIVWCLLLAGFLLGAAAAAEVEAGQEQKQVEEVGAGSGVVTDQAECIEQCELKYHWAELFQCISDCRNGRKAEAEAGRPEQKQEEEEEEVGAGSGVVAGASGCVRECESKYQGGPELVRCISRCGKANAAAASSVHVRLGRWVREGGDH